jgi:dipeptidyl aminopeptidase/acylaminoacyl peptidase
MRARRILIVLAVIVVLLLGAGYAAGGAVVYNQLSLVKPRCTNYSSPEWLANTPADFTAVGTSEIDLSPYFMPDYETVSFPSRTDNITVSGWYMPVAEEADAPTVILVHGLNDCRRSPYILMPAGMLHQADFNTLVIDLRNHGDSQVVDGRYAGGTVEYRDVLGAWDWLVNERGFAPERIGVFGTSLGAATVLIAVGEEPRITAAWEDSSFADINVAVTAELERNGFPTFLTSAAILMGRVISGHDISSKSPLAALENLDGRALFITHGTADERLNVQYASDLVAALQQEGDPVQSWIVEGSDHVRAMFDQTVEYESRLITFFQQTLEGSG